MQIVNVRFGETRPVTVPVYAAPRGGWWRRFPPGAKGAETPGVIPGMCRPWRPRWWQVLALTPLVLLALVLAPLLAPLLRKVRPMRNTARTWRRRRC